MSVASVQAQNMGWVAQHEVAFTVPLQRWRLKDGELAFDDWACVSPFIYVDDQLSLNTGREVYGWNKVTGVIDSGIPRWVNDPRSDLLQFGMSIVDFSNAYVGEESALRRLLRADLDAPPTFTEFPFNPRNPWSPLWAIPEALSNATSLAQSGLEILLAPRIRGYESHRNLDAIRAMIAKAGEKLGPLIPRMITTRDEVANPGKLADAIAGLPNLFTNNVTVKQFRNPEDPALACYQALINSKMGVDRVNRFGMLGDINMLRGDSAGGYSLRLYEMDSQPIIQTLGLEVESQTKGEGGVPVATL
jgi:hypothetical protein